MFPPPKTLDDLLVNLVDMSRSDIDASNVDKYLKTHHWSNQFLLYLRRKKLAEDEDLFKFLVLVQFLMHIDEELSSKCGQGPEKSRLRSDIFNSILQNYFREGSETMIALSNQKLFEALASRAASTHLECDSESMNYLKKARDDSSVWSDGLETTYVAFLKQAPASPSKLACLLSIL